ncbi:MAG: adenylate/guanylate cyclase domain-containing protein [Flavobacteriales bacterium]|nr:adenylate/guanylate cyclase domain-containing protein [Flavobacteriales bacterium]
MLLVSTTAVGQGYFDDAKSNSISWDTVHFEISRKAALPFDYPEGMRKNFSYLSKYENLDVSHIFTLCMDSRQNIWMGGGLGEVIRFNGSFFENYHFDHFSSNPIYKIFEDAKGNMWFGSLSDGLIRFDGHHALAMQPDSTFSLESLGVWEIFEDASGVVWVSTNDNGLIGLKGDSYVRLSTQNVLPDNQVSCALVDHKGALWCGYYNNRLSRLHNGKLEVFNEATGLDAVRIFYIKNVGEEVFIATRKGLYQWNERDGMKPVEWATGIFFLDIEEDNKHNLWLATNGWGLVKIPYRDGQLALNEPLWFKQKDGLIQERLLDIESDDDGNLWIGTFGSGLVKHSPDVFSNLNTQSGLPADKPWTMLDDNEGGLMVGLSRGGIGRVIADTCIALPLVPGIEKKDVHDMLYLRDGSLCFSVAGEGVYIKPKDETEADAQPKLYPFARELSNKMVMDIFEGGDDLNGHHQLLLASLNGLMEIQDDTLRPVEFMQGTMLNDVYQIVQGPDGKYWVASSDGVICLYRKNPTDEKLSFSPTSEFKQTLGKQITALAIADGLLIIGTEADGVLIVPYDVLTASLLKHDFSKVNEVMIELRESNGLLSDNVTTVFVDSEKSFWVGTTRGLCRLRSEPFKKILTGNFSSARFEFFTFNAGLVDPEISYHNTYEEPGGKIWFCTNSALVSFNPEVYETDRQNPAIELNNVQLFFDDVDWKNDGRVAGDANYFSSLLLNYIQFGSLEKFSNLPSFPVFSYNLNHLTFQFTAKEWSYNEAVQVFIKMDGVDEEWSLVRENSVTYSSLAPGKYTLNLQAVNSSGLKSDVLSYALTIMPPFWKTLWFRILMLMLAGLMLYLIYKWRVRSLEKEKLVLEAKVEERTDELRLERDKSEQLLLNILPKETADELKLKGEAETRVYDSASVLFSDFVGFTELTQTMEPKVLVNILDSYIRAFDKASSQYRIEKIKTIGDAYMCASGLPLENKRHAVELVAMGLEMLSLSTALGEEWKSKGMATWQIRIGIHSGPIIAGVVGKKKFAYDIWGDTVNTAARMESCGEAQHLNISPDTVLLVERFFQITSRGKVEVKGKGLIEMFFVMGFKPEFSHPQNAWLPNEIFRDEVMRFD